MTKNRKMRMQHISSPVLKTVLGAIEKAPPAQRRSRLDMVLKAKMISPEHHEKLVKELCHAE